MDEVDEEPPSLLTQVHQHHGIPDYRPQWLR